MAKIKHTKTELKAQREALQRFERFLPMLQLKKQQLQAEIQRVDNELAENQKTLDAAEARLESWVRLFSEPGAETLADQVKVEEIQIDRGNIAGVDIPLFKGVRFASVQQDLFETPAWHDDGIALLQELIELRLKHDTLHRQRDAIAEELRVTSQRVNLFEKVKIPETRDIIRVIKIYLGDEQTAAVVRGKIAKNRTPRDEAA